MSRSLVIKTVSKLNNLLDEEEGNIVGGAKPRKGGCGPWGYPYCGQAQPGPISGGAISIPYGLYGGTVYGGAPSGATTNIYQPGFPYAAAAGRKMKRRSKRGGAKSNPWVVFLKHLEQQTGRSYSDLLADPRVSAQYHSQRGYRY